jgi:thiosulfate reductase cytochrome b subunit
VYAVFALITRHLRKNLLPATSDFAWRSLARELTEIVLLHRKPDAAGAYSYNVIQRLTYLFVVFVLFPLVIWTGLAMSPAVVSVFPSAVTVFGGHQSARTIHFVVSASLVLFLVGHVAMVCRAGFIARTRAMITGRINSMSGQQ